jgi:acetoin utilization deacetylase AcuC-like enzyme
MTPAKLITVYYNISKNKYKNHFENHDRIIISVNYLKKNLIKYIPIYDNDFSLNQIKNRFNMDKEEIANILLFQIYSKAYLEKIKNISENLEENEIKNGDTYFSNVTYNEIIDNSIIMLNVCYEICDNNIKHAYCLIRPPSHHAKQNNYEGFCIINHTYLTAKYLHDRFYKTVLILDYDVHHGNGTQELVKKNIKNNIYFVSMHCYDSGFYPGTGNIDENNEKVLNIPFKKGLTDEEYIENFEEKVIPFIDNKNINIIIVSNGLDAHIDDPFQIMKLTNKFYVHVTKYLNTLQIPLIYILEGGYNPDIIGNVSVDIIEELID